jgi:response regulator RpfG family c-di-GMP phosphodiesterase
MLMPTSTPIPSRDTRELGLAYRARRREERVSIQLELVDQYEVALPRSKYLRAAPLHDLGLVAHPSRLATSVA